MKAAWALTRWMWRDRRAAVLSHVLPQLLVVAFVAVQADAIVDVPGLSRELRALPPGTVGGGVGLLLLLQALSQRSGVVSLLWSPSLGVLWRQPASGVAWSLATGAVLLAMAGPIAALAMLWYGPLALDAILLWTALWSALAGVVALPDRRALATPVLALAAASVVAAAHAAPVLRPLFAVATVGAVLVAWGPAYRSAVPRLKAVSRVRAWRPRSALAALVQRDLLVLWRTDRRVVGSAVAAALVVGAVAMAVQRNNALGGDPLGAAVVVCLAFVAPLIGALLDLLVRALGRQLDPPSWPLSRWQRGAALATTAALTLVPSWAAAAVSAPALGLAGHLRIAVFVGLCAVGGAWFVAARRRRVNLGAWLWWVMLAAGVACVRWPAAVVLSGALGTFAWWGTLRGLARGRRRP